MEYRAREEGRIVQSRFLEISPDVLQFDGVRSSADVSNSRGAESRSDTSCSFRTTFHWNWSQVYSMAERPVFVPRTDGQRLVEEVLLRFSWHPGFAPSQKKKNVVALHEAARLKGYGRVLEVSTKSGERLGQKLSAFHLKVEVEGRDPIPLESAYQGSKVFEHGGPFVDLYDAEPREARRDPRLKTSGALRGFEFCSDFWQLEPKTAFYDWLYIRAIYEHRDYLQRLTEYDAFSDIEFNPGVSLNCQARSCAMFVSLLRKNLLTEAVSSRDSFISILRPDAFAQPHSSGLRQGHLF